jgi:hypothetical protein
MLARVSATLGKFLSPLTTSIRSSLSKPKEENSASLNLGQNPKREPPSEHSEPHSQSDPEPQPQPKPQPPLKLLSESEPEKAPLDDPNRPQEPPLAPSDPESVALKVSRLLSQYGEQRERMRRWGGAKTYQAAAGTQGKGNLRKGTIFDENSS